MYFFGKFVCLEVAERDREALEDQSTETGQRRHQKLSFLSPDSGMTVGTHSTFATFREVPDVIDLRLTRPRSLFGNHHRLGPAPVATRHPAIV